MTNFTYDTTIDARINAGLRRIAAGAGDLNEQIAALLSKYETLDSVAFEDALLEVEYLRQQTPRTKTELTREEEQELMALAD